METNNLKAIIEQVLREMNVSSADLKEDVAAAVASKAVCEGKGLEIPSKGITLDAPVVEEGCLEDITEIDIRTQYLVENPVNKEAYAEQKMAAP